MKQVDGPAGAPGKRRGEQPIRRQPARPALCAFLKGQDGPGKPHGTRGCLFWLQLVDLFEPCYPAIQLIVLAVAHAE